MRKLIFLFSITRLLTHFCVSFPFSSPFYVMGALWKVTLSRNSSQLSAQAKRSRDNLTPAYQEEIEFRIAEGTAFTSRPSSSFAPSSSFGVEATLAAILDQLQLVRGDIGVIRKLQTNHDDFLTHLTDKMSQMNPRIGHIACLQSRLGGFVPTPENVYQVASSASGDDDKASSTSSNDEMTTSQ